MPKNRTQTQDLKGSASSVTPQADFRDRSFIVRPSRLAIGATDFASLSAKFADIAVDQKIAKDDKALAQGAIDFQALQDTAEKDQSESLKKLAKAVRDGKLEEQYSPAFIIGYRRASGNAMQARAANVIKQRIRDSFAQSQTDAELGLSTEVPSFSDISTKAYDEVFNEAKGVNEALTADFYWQDAFSRGRGKAEPELLALYNEVKGEALKAGMRANLGAQVQTVVSGASSLSGVDLREYVQQAGKTFDTLIRKATVKDPFKLISKNVKIALGNMAREGGLEGVARAEESLRNLSGMSLGATKFGDTEESLGLWDFLTQRRSVAESDTSHAHDISVSAAVDTARDSEDQDNAFNAVALAPTASAAQGVYDDLVASGAESLEARFGKHYAAVLGELAVDLTAKKRVLASGSNDAYQKSLELLTDGDIEGAKEASRGLSGEQYASMQDRLKSYSTKIEDGFNGTQKTKDALSEISREAEALMSSGEPLLPSDRATVMQEEARFMQQWRRSAVDVLLATPDEQREEALKQIYGPQLTQTVDSMQRVVKAARDRANRVNVEVQSATETLDSKAVADVLNRLNVTGEDRLKAMRPVQEAQLRTLKLAESIANWSSIQAQLTPLLLDSRVFGDLKAKTKSTAGEIGKGEPSLGIRGKQKLAEVMDFARSGVNEWLLTEEGRQARLSGDVAFAEKVKDKARELALGFVSEAEAGKAADKTAAAVAGNVSPGTPGSNYAEYIKSVQAEQSGMSLSDAFYGIPGSSPGWKAAAALLHAPAGKALGSTLRGMEIPTTFGARAPSLGGRTTQLPRTQKLMNDGLAEALGIAFPVQADSEEAKANMGAAMGAYPYTPSDLLSKVSDALGVGDVVSMSVSLRSSDMQTYYMRIDTKALGGSPRVVDVVAFGISRAAKTLRVQLGELHTNGADAAEVTTAMTALAEVAGMAPHEALRHTFDNGVPTPDNLDPARIPFFQDYDSLRKYTKSKDIDALLEAVGMSTDDKAKSDFLLMQTRLLYK